MRIALTAQVHAFLQDRLVEGDYVIDATAGNGHDTLQLATRVGPSGRVFAFDKQAAAIESARARLTQAGLAGRVTWLCTGHEHMQAAIPSDRHGRFKLVMFNLGYLPGGDKTHTTQTSTTLAALDQARQMLMPGGMISIVAYTGHPGGRAEAEAVKHWAQGQGGLHCEVLSSSTERANAPEWLCLTKGGAI